MERGPSTKGRVSILGLPLSAPLIEPYKAKTMPGFVEQKPPEGGEYLASPACCWQARNDKLDIVQRFVKIYSLNPVEKN